jgi:hypothetical protein
MRLLGTYVEEENIKNNANMFMNCSLHEDGTMLATSYPPDIRIYNTRRRGNDAAARVEELGASMCPTMLDFLHRHELPSECVRFNTKARLSLFS